MLLNAIFLLLLGESAYSVSAPFSLKPNYDNNVCKHIYDYLTIYINKNCWFNPDVKSLTDAMILRRGYPLEVYEVVTQDGYILTLYRIPHNNVNVEAKRQPVFLQHGLLMDSAIWADVGNRSLAFNFAEAGYDVWMGNFRGTRPSLRHVNMTSSQKEYWDFSYHEMGIYDLPTMLGFVVEKTGQAGNIIYLGHSMGTTSFFIFSSLFPELAKSYVVGGIMCAPVVYLTHFYEQLPLLRVFVPIVAGLAEINDKLGIVSEGDSTGFLQNTVIKWFCELFPAEYRFCSIAVFLSVGIDPKELQPEDLPLLFNHATVAGSTKSTLHYSQWIFSGKFAYYDYGRRKNLKVYGTAQPPLYPIKKVKVPIYLYYGKRDVLATPSDAHRLYNELETPIKEINHLAPDDSVQFNHIDFMFAKDIIKAMYVPLADLINRRMRRNVNNEK